MKVRICNTTKKTIMKGILKSIAIIFLAFFQWQCSISLSGISIDPNIDTFNVETFENNADLVEPTLALDLTEALKERIRNSSRLDWNKVPTNASPEEEKQIIENLIVQKSNHK